MLEDKLKDLIIKRFGSVRQFSLKINIPYTTVDTILKRGIDNSNVGNVLKMCKALNISIDYLLDNKEIQANNLSQNKQEQDLEHIQEYNFGDIKVTLSKNGKITDKDMLELNQFLMQEKLKDNSEK